MKKIILGALLASNSMAYAESYVCKDIYTAKITKIEKRSNLRKAVKGGITVMVGFAGGIAIAASNPLLLPLGVAFYGSLAGFPIGMGVYTIANALDREDGLRDAIEAQELMNTSYADILARLREDQDVLIKKLIQNFEAQVSNPDFLNQLVYHTNNDRLGRGLPYLSSDQVIKHLKNQIILEVSSRPLLIENSITKSLDLAKRKNKVPKDFTYDSWIEVLNSNQEKFCVSGRALTLRQATLTILKDI